MIACHFHMKLANCTIERHITILLVHVVDAGPGLVAEDDAESFHVVRSALIDLIHRENLTLGTFGLQLLPQMIPEL